MVTVPIRDRLRVLTSSVLLLCSVAPGLAQQMNDPDFDARVDKPAFREKHPQVLHGSRTVQGFRGPHHP